MTALYARRAVAAVGAAVGLAALALPPSGDLPVQTTAAEQPQATATTPVDPGDAVYARPRADSTAPVLPFTPTTADPERCADDAGTWMGTRWRSTLHWRFNAASTPRYLADRAAVASAVRLAADGIDTGTNVCGLPRHLRTAQAYDGPTTRTAAVTRTGGCGNRDGVNTVSFGRLDPGVLALTCIWWLPGRSGDGTTVEADILVRDSPDTFFLAAPGGCAQQWDLRSALTHEFGHAFGLGHVAAADHGGQTMSDALPACTTDRRQLARGDYDALRAHYGAD